MKRIVTYLFLVFLASLVFYGGAGVNLVSYCCSCCEENGIETLTNESCCKMHDSSMGKHTCGIRRINFKWISDEDNIVDLQPVEHDLFLASLQEHLIITFYNKPFFEDLHAIGPPKVACPRTYLSLLTTLLI